MFSVPTIILLCLLNVAYLHAQVSSSLSSTGRQLGSSSEFGSLSQFPSITGSSTVPVYAPYSSPSQYRGSSYGQAIQGQVISPFITSQYPYSQQRSIYGTGVSPSSSLSSLYGNGGSIFGNGLSPYESSAFGSFPYSQGSSLETGVAPYSSMSSSSPAYCCVSMTNPVPTTPYGSSGSVPAYTSPMPSTSSLYNSGALSAYGSYPATTTPSLPYSSGIGASSYTSMVPTTPMASLVCYPLCPNAYGSGSMGSYGSGVQSPYTSSNFGAGSPYFSGFGTGFPYSSSDFGLTSGSIYPYLSTGTTAPTYPYSVGFGSEYLGGATTISPYSNFNGVGFGGLTGNGFGEGFGPSRFGSFSNFPRRATSSHSTTSPSSGTAKAEDKKTSGAAEDSLAHVPYAAAAAAKKQ